MSAQQSPYFEQTLSHWQDAFESYFPHLPLQEFKLTALVPVLPPPPDEAAGCVAVPPQFPFPKLDATATRSVISIALSLFQSPLAEYLPSPCFEPNACATGTKSLISTQPSLFRSPD